MATKTYYTTRTSGEVRRLDDLTTPWIDVSVPGAGKPLLDIMAFPNSPDSVLTCSDENNLWLSTDAGLNWAAPGGNWNLFPGTNYKELWIIDGSNSYVVGSSGAVVKSTDGGLNFIYTASAPTGSGSLDPDFNAESVHFITPLIGVVGVVGSGNGATVFKTIDGGATWTWINGGNFIALTSNAMGIHISADETIINLVTDKGVFRSIDSGATFNEVLDLVLFGFGSGIHLTWINDNELWVTGLYDTIHRTVDAGANWSVVRPGIGVAPSIQGAHFYNSNDGFVGAGSDMSFTPDGGITLVSSEIVAPVIAVWTESDEIPLYFILRSCDINVYPDIIDVTPGMAVDLNAVVGQVISTLDPLDVTRCYTVEIQVEPFIGPGFVVNSYNTVGTDCADFSITSICPIEIPLTVVGNTEMFQVEITNTGSDAHDFTFTLGSCTTSGISIITPSPLNIPAGGIAFIDLEYTPIISEQGTCEIIVNGPCGELTCNLCFHSVSVPDCPHFKICIVGPTCAPDCIKPGDVVSFDLGGNISPIAYPTVVTFSVRNQITQQIVFTQNFDVADDAELDAIIINIIAGAPGKYCAEVCLPGCNTIRFLCFDVCEPFDIYKDECYKWHVHRPTTCNIEEYIVTVYPFGDAAHPVIADTIWDVSQDNSFEFQVTGDGIYVFEMKDPVTGEVLYSFAAFETCDLQECFKILMDKIMCSCSDPCCKRCDGTPNEHREFARMTLNMLMPLYFTYLGMARRNELYTVGMKLIGDDQHCFLHDATQILNKIKDIIMDCGCLCPEQKNTATNRGDCQSC